MCLASAACGAQRQAATSATGDAASLNGPYLCTGPSQPTRLEVRRQSSLDRQYSFPADVVITAAPQLAAVARVICALTSLVPGTYHCGPALVTYTLQFSAASKHFRLIGVGTPDDCPFVNGIDSRLIRSASVWTNLGVALRLSPADAQTFEGME